MTTETFKLEFDPNSKITYVRKVQDELTKNHHETDRELVTGFMPQLKSSDGTVSKLCLVRSFENYVDLLDKKVNYLWQKPKSKIPKNGLPWYIPQKVGHNTHEKFIGNISKEAKLSQHYTNHCIRVSGVTNLSRANFSAKQVMAVSGHKSVESLAIYQRVHEDEKMMMDLCLTYSLIQPQNASLPEIQPTPRKQLALTYPQTRNPIALISPPSCKVYSYHLHV